MSYWEQETQVVNSARCNMICQRYNLGTCHWFSKGLKYCSECNIAVPSTFRHCPCCRILLRCKPRNSPAYKKIRVVKRY